MRTFLLSLFITLITMQNSYGDEIYPLGVGNYWKYQITGKKPALVTNTISDSKTINGTTWFKLNEYGEIFWVRNSLSGQSEATNLFEEKDIQKTNNIAEALMYKYPYTIGETYISDGNLVKIEAEKNITVPAGEFKCVIYFIDFGNGSYSRSCIAKGVGVVTNEYMSNGVLEVSKLVKYGTN